MKANTATRTLPASLLPRHAATKNAPSALRRPAGEKRLATPVSDSIKADSFKAQMQVSDGIGGHSSRTKNRPASTDVASRTHGISRDKKTSQGKWVPKTSKELKSELLALTAPRSTVPSAPRFVSMKKVIARTIQKTPCVDPRSARSPGFSEASRVVFGTSPDCDQANELKPGIVSRHRQAHRPRHCQALPGAPGRLNPCVDPWQRSFVHRFCAVPLRISTRASAQTYCDQKQFEFLEGDKPGVDLHGFAPTERKNVAGSDCVV